jgi:hypothetical protein
MADELQLHHLDEPKVWSKDKIIYTPTEVPSVYTNNVTVNFTNWDVSLTFGEIAGEKDDNLLVDRKIRVTMSLQHGKAFIELFNNIMAEFEDKFGLIQSIRPKPAE